MAQTVLLALAATGFLLMAAGAYWVFSRAGDSVEGDLDLSAVLGAPRVAVLFRAPGSSGPFTGASPLHVAPGGEVLLPWQDNILAVPGDRPLLQQPEHLSSFAVTSGGLVLAARGSRLGYVGEGSLKAEVPLPSSDMRLEPIDADRICLWGPLSSGHWGIFILSRGGTWAKILTFPYEITALAGTGRGLVFASGGSVYQLAFGGRAIPLLYLPDRAAIISLAYDPGRGAVFLSTTRSVYVLARGRLEKLLDQVSGSLRWSGQSLLILAQDPPALLRVDGIFR